MARSLGLPGETPCPSCGARVPRTIWMIVDQAERPDLAELLRGDRLGEERCPECLEVAPAPKDFVLLHLPGENPPLILGVPDAPKETIESMGSALLSELREAMGTEWQDEWIAEMPVVPRDDLAEAYRGWLTYREQVGPGQLDDAALAEAENVAAGLFAETDAGVYRATHAFVGEQWFNRVSDDRAGDVENAIAHLTAAAAASRADEDADLWAALMIKLSHAYIARVRGDHADNLERAIRYARSVLEASGMRDEARARAAGNAALALLERGAGDPVSNIEEAIELLLSALATFRVTGERHEGATAAMHLARAYALRFQGTRADNGREAMRYADIAVEGFVAVGRAQEAAGALIALGNVCLMHGGEDGDEEGRRQATEAYQRGLDLPELPGYQRAQLHMCLGNLYRGQHRGEHTAQLDLALEHYEQAATALDRDRHPLEWAGVQQNMAWAYAYRQEPGDADRAAQMLEAAAEVFGTVHAVREYAQVTAELGRLLFDQGRWAEAVAVYEDATAAGEAALHEADTPDGRRVAVARLAGAHPNWAYALLRLDRPEEALTALEAGKQRLARQRAATQAWPMEEIAELVPPQGAIVVLIATSQGAAALVLIAGTTQIGSEQIVPLPDFTTPRLQGLLVNEVMLLSEGDDRLFAMLGAGQTTIDLHAYADDFDQLGHRLWDQVVGAVAERLGRLGVADGAPVVLVPHGGLGLLPLHAAGPQGGLPFADRHPVIYAPSLDVLRAGRQRLTESAGIEDRLLALADPVGDLPYARAETALCAAYFPAAESYTGSQATKRVLLDRLGEATHVHLACHGRYDWTTLMQSALQLAGDEYLRLEETTSALLSAHIRLAFLSACETGISSVGGLADEYLGFSAALHRAGVPVVVSTLWAVPDSVMAMVAIEFYRRLRDLRQRPAEALQGAQLWLRDATRETLLQWLTTAAGQARELPDGRDAWLGFQRLRERIRDTTDPGETPYASAAFWASLVVSGYAYE
jgi:CHAT domain-containing protein/tetratricopeptide (TPR) repeat protein